MPPVVVYVHGVGNKVAKESLRRRWDQALFGAALDSRSHMAYWADLRYPAPLGESGEEVEQVEEVGAVLAVDGGDLRWSEPPDPDEFVESMVAEAVTSAEGRETGEAEHHAGFEGWARRMTYAADALAAGEAPVTAATAEALPVPRPIRQAAFRALVKVTLKDVYAYFFGGQRNAIQDRLREALRDVGGPAVVVGHSLGSVIAYDVLRSWEGPALEVPLLVTLGSPLGVQEIEDVVVQPLEVPDPADQWVNACDARDLVALDATVRDEYPPAVRVRDYIVANDSENHHDIGNYLRSAVVQQVVHAAMGLDGGSREATGGRTPAEGGRTARKRGGRKEAAPQDKLHTPVTNTAVEAGVFEERLVSEPEPGEVDAVEPAADGTEAVDGRGGRELAAVPTAPSTVLPDIGVASFGGHVERAPAPVRRSAFSTSRSVSPLMETVHFGDDRVQVTDTQHYPYSAIASLLITARDGSQWVGTGWFVSPRTLLTAGHCVYITNSPVPGRNGWVLNIQVLPGRNGTALPFGSVTSTHFCTVRGWAEQGNENYDYGAIVLPTPVGQTVGTFGFAVLPDTDLDDGVLNIAGYPGDKPAGTLWYASRKTASVNPSKVHYDIDTAGGQSGAPVYVVDGDKRIGVAVHAYGGPTTNSGTRISPPVYDNVSAWKE